MTWQPIETAPKDGKSIILGCNYKRFGKMQVAMAWWYEGHWIEGFFWCHCEDAEPEKEICLVEFRPSHWMPLPDPPKGAGQ